MRCRHLGDFRACKANGPWVGSRIEISDDGTRFAANKLNKTLIQIVEAFAGAMTSLRAVVLAPGWITEVIGTTRTGDEFRFRVFGAKDIVDELNRHLLRS
jgi:hypothetical protein